ncbi:MAG: SDR family NAD(P)-dependent oxidoreductase [Alphaproteobacteria bacterium]|jgi:NAD(P)-dependent dehydrogenase (short-subunit alcohol dehydrogenase family)|nr:SDR family NAD(P)-dependent oxidoreductase [Alphaproteobacteria bacterium]
MAKRLQDRVALITGASRGIGAAVAEAYAAAGAHVILVARTSGGLEEVDDAVQAVGGSATLAPLDLTQPDVIEALGASVFERWGRLDILVGNAATLGELAPVGHIAPDAWAEALTLNLTANWRLIRSFDPLLRQSDAGRAIFFTSGATRSLPPYWAAYSATKAALEALVVTYAREVERTPIRVNLVNPGPTRTAMRAKSFPGESPDSLPPPEHVVETLIRLAEPSFTGHGLWIAADQPEPLAGID